MKDSKTKLERIRELMEHDHPGISTEGALQIILDDCLRDLEERAANRAFHITFREPPRRKLTVVSSNEDTYT